MVKFVSLPTCASKFPAAPLPMEPSYKLDPALAVTAIKDGITLQVFLDCTVFVC